MTIKILPYDGPATSFTENEQTIKVKFAFARVEEGNLRPAHKFVKCRDYFNEYVLACRWGVDMDKIYGFVANGSANPIDLSDPYLILKMERKGDRERFIENLRLLKELEARHLVGTTEDVAAEDDKIAISFSPFWMKTTVHMSLFTMIIRYLTVAETDKAIISEYFRELIDTEQVQYSDKSFLTNVMENVDLEAFVAASADPDGGIQKAIEFGKRVCGAEDENKAAPINAIHNTGGILSFANFIKLGEEQYAKSGAGKTMIDYFKSIYSPITEAENV